MRDFKKSGFPNDGEIVLCTVKKILKTTVFVRLDEYQDKEGIIHISEISPGRIRTIRDFVREGKKIVCKVLRKNEKYQNLDLSLRRVTTGQKLNKLKEVKLEDNCEKIIKAIASQMKLDFKKLYMNLRKDILKEYETLSQCFQEIAETEELSLTKLGVERNIATNLEAMIRTRLKPQEIKVSRIINLTCPTPSGIESIKKSIKKALQLAEKNGYNLKLTYISAPKYSVTISSLNPKQAENEVEEIIDKISKEIEKEKGTIEIEKEKK
tara:strand:- start:10068 stop:10868 length:801 start_codon:yes stop_codon:yes gene_type:complete